MAILLFFGADESLLALAETYLMSVKAVVPLLLFNQMLAAFLRNDNPPELATAGVLAGGLFNAAFDYIFIFIIDMGILTVLFYRQIMRYLGSNALSVYDPVINVSTIVQCCAYSAGQAAQPIISINFGAKKWQRIKETLRYALYTVGVFSTFWTVFSLI